MKTRGNVVMMLIERLLKPLMNQRGAVGDADPNAVEVDENGFIPGTSYKSVSDLIKGHTDLKGKFDAQGNELGSLRKQTETLATTLKDTLTKKDQPADPAKKTADYDTELSTVEDQIKKLDPMKENYQETLADLVKKATKLSAQSQHEKTLSAAGELMKKELTERDVKAQTKAFHDANPTFNTPEMQTRIKEYLAKDKTGMSDPLVAFREIERDDIAAKATVLETENAEMKKALALQQGKESTGKVVTKGQSPGAATKSPKLTGKDLDNAMMGSLNKG